MATDASERTTYVVMWDAHNSVTHLAIEAEPIIDAHVSRYVESGCTRDELLHLPLLEGPIFHTRVSDIVSWFISTPESRAINKALNAEGKPAKWEDSE